MTERLVVIDGDLLAYRCSAATEKRAVLATHTETLEQCEFDTATLFKEWAGPEADNYILSPQQTAEPIAHTIRAMKGTLTKILDKTKCIKYHIVISGEDNFRKNIPLPTQYKNNRSATAKPINLAEAKEYLVKYHNAEIAVGEADEVLVAYGYQGLKDGNVIIQATIDKDANTGPSWVYNWNEMEEPELIQGFGKLELVEHPSYTDVKGKGRVFLIYQILYGDPADGYKPCELAKTRFGDKGAYKLLKDCTTDKEALQVLVNQYKKWYPKPVIYRAWDDSMHTKDWMQICQMYADCAYMPKWDGDRLVVKDILDKLKVEY